MNQLPDTLLSTLQSRDVALWVWNVPNQGGSTEALLKLIGLPWRFVVVEGTDSALVGQLEGALNADALMVQRRGYVQLVEGDPSRIELPPRCLPIYLLEAQKQAPAPSLFEAQLRRLTMLEVVRRAGVREILVLSGGPNPLPAGLRELTASGFRSFATFISESATAEVELARWLRDSPGGAPGVSLVPTSPVRAAEASFRRYQELYPETGQTLRIRDRKGQFHHVNASGLDEPERPLLDWFSLIEERDLTPLVPEALSEEDFNGFFSSPALSWRPYAAGLPWIKDRASFATLTGVLRTLDARGPETNCVAYVVSEAGAGGTTLARALAWDTASLGYPVLVAKPIPFVPDARAVSNFLQRLHQVIEGHSAPKAGSLVGNTEARPATEASAARYEVPCVLVFDSLHWDNRDSDLLRFRNELERSGRPVCILVVTGPVLGIGYYNASVFKKLAELNHLLSSEDAESLGTHLNRYLSCYGKARSMSQWQRFYEDHTVRYLEGTAAFWVTLSFWIQSQYDLSETVQEWIYRIFLRNADSTPVRRALLEVAAMSSERLPLAEELLPESGGEWPMSLLLEDRRSVLAGLGLARLSTDGRKYWALVHDILGRLLINAAFYDIGLRREVGFEDAKSAEHLRFLLLRQISRKPVLGERALRQVGEQFATQLFKVDPDHGRGSFVLYWREVLEALDAMPRTLRDTSRLFRHHCAVSRRRIAQLDERLFGVTEQDQHRLVAEAIEDIKYALTCQRDDPNAEADLNLYNSLANAYFDLERIEAAAGASRDRVLEIRRLANDATRRAYEESPTNSFVLETYVKNLLQEARETPESAIKACVEALGMLFSALSVQSNASRTAQLAALAEQALRLLLQQTPAGVQPIAPKSAIDVLLLAWRALAAGFDDWARFGLSSAPEENQRQALEALSNPAGRGNTMVVRLSYDLTASVYPLDFRRQLELVEQLQSGDYRMTPQLRLEYAILLFQNLRHSEGERVFRSLRELWRNSEHFVYVPERLRWLMAAGGNDLAVVQAVIGSEGAQRSMARVQEFGNAAVPFRPQEHGLGDARPGKRFRCHVSFGHNGPFLRPLTAGPAVTAGN